MSSNRDVLARWSIALLMVAVPLAGAGDECLVVASFDGPEQREDTLTMLDASQGSPMMSEPSDRDEFGALGFSGGVMITPDGDESAARYDSLSAYDRLQGDADPYGANLFDDDALFDEEFDLDLPDSSVPDPIEGFNRHVFKFNEVLDTFAWDPLTRGYQFLMPPPARRGVHRFFQNLESPVVFANQVLQLNLKEASVTLGRFLVNTTAGMAGLLDPAEDAVGLDRVDADFGQTLARYGVPSGPYLMVPLLGPSNVRDFSGDLVDRLLDPLTYLVGPIQWWIVLGTSQGLAEREAHIRDLDALEASSIDFYAALRSAYSQSRRSAVHRARGEPDGAEIELVSGAAL